MAEAVMRDEAGAAIDLRGRRLALIFNPTAGGWRRRRFAAALERLNMAGCDVRLLATGKRGDAERFAATAAGESDVMVAAGGDGTINEVINGMAGSRVPLGLLPLGT